MTDVWHRFEDRLYAGMYDDFDGHTGPSRLAVEHREFEVIRETPKGVWLRDFLGERWVRRDARKRYACPTKEEALDSFVARKKRQMAIHAARAHRAERAIQMAAGLR